MTTLIIVLIVAFIGNGILLAFLKGATADEYTRILEMSLYAKEHPENEGKHE